MQKKEKRGAHNEKLSDEAMLRAIEQLEKMFFDENNRGTKIEDANKLIQVEGVYWRVIGEEYSGKITCLSPQAGLVIKFYFIPDHATTVLANLEAIRPHVDQSGYQLLMPIITQGRAHVFPYLTNFLADLSDRSSQATLKLQTIINRTAPTMTPAVEILFFNVEGALMVVDPLEDNWPT